MAQERCIEEVHLYHKTQTAHLFQLAVTTNKQIQILNHAVKPFELCLSAL